MDNTLEIENQKFFILTNSILNIIDTIQNSQYEDASNTSIHANITRTYIAKRLSPIIKQLNTHLANSIEYINTLMTNTTEVTEEITQLITSNLDDQMHLFTQIKSDLDLISLISQRASASSHLFKNI